MGTRMVRLRAALLLTVSCNKISIKDLFIVLTRVLPPPNYSSLLISCQVKRRLSHTHKLCNLIHYIVQPVIRAYHKRQAESIVDYFHSVS
jgi:hypothetical protein